MAQNGGSLDDKTNKHDNFPPYLLSYNSYSLHSIILNQIIYIPDFNKDKIPFKRYLLIVFKVLTI